MSNAEVRSDGLDQSDLVRLFTQRTESYGRFIRGVLYPQGIRAFFMAASDLAPARVLDAGCGTGVVTLALRDALIRRGLTPTSMHAFDLTPAMLSRFRRTIEERGIHGIELAQADVLDLAGLPRPWKDYDLVVSASMLEYVPRERLSAALSGLRTLLRPEGRFVLFMTRRNWLMRPLIGRWWRGHLYKAEELEHALKAAGYRCVSFRRFPVLFQHLNLWGHVVEARASLPAN